jgi:hypothetical protein
LRFVSPEENILRATEVVFLLICFVTPLVAQKSDLKQSTEAKQGQQTQSQNSMQTSGSHPADAQPEEGEYKGPWKGLQYRLVGPFRGGRVVAAAGVVGSPDVYYFGAVAGGVWKTTDGGLNWKPVFDKTENASPSIGALAVSQSDPNVIYVGTGEACIRGNIVGGNGVYKSIDAGATWKSVGLTDTHAIGRLIVNPKNPDVAFVAALGHPFADNEERGIFRTQDGGKTWQKVLYKDAQTGGIDVVFDPSNANILYAALWQDPAMIASEFFQKRKSKGVAMMALMTMTSTADDPPKVNRAILYRRKACHSRYPSHATPASEIKNAAKL